MASRTVIADSEDDGDALSPMASDSEEMVTARHVNVPVAVPDDNNEQALQAAVSNDNARSSINTQLCLGTGSTDSAVFDAIRQQHLASTLSPNPAALIETNYELLSTGPNAATAPPQQKPLEPTKTDNIRSSSDILISTKEMAKQVSDPISSASPLIVKKLKRSKTTVVADGSSFTSPDAAMDNARIKRSKSMRPESRDMASGDLNSRAGKFGKEEKDVYDFPGSSDGRMKQITKKVAKTTMDVMKEKNKTTYGSSRRTITSINPAAVPLNVRDETADATQQDHQIREKSIENYEMENFENLVARVEKEKSKSPKTYGKSRRTKTGIPSSSPVLVDMLETAADDHQLERRKRKSDAHPESSPDQLFELPRAKRFQRQKSLSASQSSQKLAENEQERMQSMMEVSSSQIDPIIQIPDTFAHVIETPPLAAASIQVPNTTSQEMRLALAKRSGLEIQADSSAGPIIPATKSSSGNQVVVAAKTLHHEEESAVAVAEEFGRAESGKVEIDDNTRNANNDGSAAVSADHFNTSPLSISFDKGLEATGMVLIDEKLTESQKDEYRAVSVSSTFEHAQGHELHDEIGPSTLHKISGASSTIANSTWKSPRPPTVEPLSSPEVVVSARKTKRSKTGLELDKSSQRRRRSSSVVAGNIPSSSPFEAPRSSARKLTRRKTAVDLKEADESHSSQSKRTRVTTTVVTYEKLKDPDASRLSPISSPSKMTSQVQKPKHRHNWDTAIDNNKEYEAGPSTAARGKKRKSLAVDSEDELTQEQRDFELARKLQEQLNAEDERPRRSDPATPKPVEEEPLPSSQDFDAGIPKEMYKPRLSSRRSKSMASKVDPDAHERFVNTLPETGRRKKKPAKGKAKEVATQPEVSRATEIAAVDASLVEPTPSVEQLVEEPVKADKKPAKAPKKNSRTKSKLSSTPEVITLDTGDEDEEAIVAPISRARRSKPVVAESEEDELALVEDFPAPVDLSTKKTKLAKPKADANGKGKVAAKTTTTLSKEIVGSDEDSDALSDLDMSPKKAAPPPPPPPPVAVEPTPAPLPKPAPSVNKNKRQKSDLFKPPTIVKRTSTSESAQPPIEPGLQTPSKEHKTPQSTPEERLKERAKTPHSPLSSGRVPYRVGLSKKTRLPSLLKIIRKDGK